MTLNKVDQHFLKSGSDDGTTGLLLFMMCEIY